MEFFRPTGAVQKSYQAIGLDLFPSNATSKRCNYKISFIAFAMLQMFISTTAFLVFEADTVFEYATSFYTSITELLIIIIFFALNLKMDDISMNAETFEEFFKKSKITETKFFERCFQFDFHSKYKFRMLRTRNASHVRRPEFQCRSSVSVLR